MKWHVPRRIFQARPPKSVSPSTFGTVDVPRRRAPGVVKLGVIVGFGWVGVLSEGTKDAFNPGKYFFYVLLAAYK